MPDIDILIICLVAGLIGVAAGYWIRKLTAESRIGSAEKEAERIVQKAVQEAEAAKKEKVLEARDEAHSLRAEAEREIREERNELHRLKRRLMQKEEALDRKQESLERREDVIDKKERAVHELLQKAEKLKQEQTKELERVAGLTVWNETMKRQAVEIHGYRPEQVCVAGVPQFDIYADPASFATREAFFERIGAVRGPVGFVLRRSGQAPPGVDVFAAG